MPSILSRYRECFAFGGLLQKKLPGQIRDAEAQGWEAPPVDQIRDDIEKYLRDSLSLLRLITGIVVATLLPVIVCLVLRKPWGTFYALFGIWAIAALLVAVPLTWPIVALGPYIKKMPDPIYRDMLRSFWPSLEALHVAITISLFTYLFAGFELGGALPIFILIAALWLFAPLTATLLNRDSLFIRFRAIQLALLILAALFSVASPVPMKHFQLAAKRGIAEKIRPINQTEITERWETLQWFTQEGASNVWYSFNPQRGYHLFSAPGFDPETNIELTPVGDSTTVEAIKTALSVETTKQKNLEMAQDRERQRSEFVSVSGQDGIKHRVVLIVLNADQRENMTLTDRLSRDLAKAGLSNQTQIFTEKFVESPVFQEIADGRRGTSESFHAEDVASWLLLVRASTSNSREQVVASVKMQAIEIAWDVRAISLSEARIVNDFKVTAKGTGFSDADAEANATERIEADLVEHVPDLLEAISK